MTEELSKLISDLDEITKKQAAIIDRLFQLLLQYVTLDELESELTAIQEVKEISSGWDN